MLALGDGEFIAGLQRAFGTRLGRFTRVGRRQAYPLALTTADRVVSQRAGAMTSCATHRLSACDRLR